jgi:nucleoid-associated protein YgaU
MILKKSRYARVPVKTVVRADGAETRALGLRRLPAASGVDAVVKGNDRLDIMAQRLYGDPTQFWRIADANSELRANDLAGNPGRTIQVP